MAGEDLDPSAISSSEVESLQPDLVGKGTIAALMRAEISLPLADASTGESRQRLEVMADSGDRELGGLGVHFIRREIQGEERDVLNLQYSEDWLDKLATSLDYDQDHMAQMHHVDMGGVFLRALAAADLDAIDVDEKLRIANDVLANGVRESSRNSLAELMSRPDLSDPDDLGRALIAVRVYGDLQRMTTEGKSLSEAVEALGDVYLESREKIVDRKYKALCKGITQEENTERAASLVQELVDISKLRTRDAEAVVRSNWYGKRTAERESVDTDENVQRERYRLMGEIVRLYRIGSDRPLKVGETVESRYLQIKDLFGVAKTLGADTEELKLIVEMEQSKAAEPGKARKGTPDWDRGKAAIGGIAEGLQMGRERAKKYKDLRTRATALGIELVPGDR